MANNQSIQFLRKEGEPNYSELRNLLPGQPLYDMTDNKLYIGNGGGGNLVNPRAPRVVRVFIPEVEEVVAAGVGGFGNLYYISDKDTPQGGFTYHTATGKEDGSIIPIPASTGETYTYFDPIAAQDIDYDSGFGDPSSKFSIEIRRTGGLDPAFLRYIRLLSIKSFFVQSVVNKTIIITAIQYPLD